LIEHFWTFGGNFFFYGTFFSYMVFLLLFTRSHWWETAMGKHVFVFMLVFAVLFGLGIVSRVVSPEWFAAHAAALRFWCFFATFVVGWWRVGLLIVAQSFNPEKAMRPAGTPTEEDVHG